MSSDGNGKPLWGLKISRIPKPRLWAARECLKPEFLKTLSPDELQFWSDFVAEYYANSRNGIQSPEQMRERYRATNAAYRDILSWKGAVGCMVPLPDEDIYKGSYLHEDEAIARIDRQREIARMRGTMSGKKKDVQPIEEDLPEVTSWAVVKVKGGYMPVRITSIGTEITKTVALEEKPWNWEVCEETVIRDFTNWRFREDPEEEG